LKTRVLRRLAPRGDDSSEMQIRLAVDLAEAGRYAQARQAREMALRSVRLSLRDAREDPLVLNDCAVNLADLGEFDISIKLLKRAHELAPQNSHVLFNLSTVLWRRGHYRDAAHVATKAVALAPDDPGIGDLLQRIHGTLLVFDERVPLLAHLETDDETLGERTPGTGRIAPLHVLRMSLPFRQTGYSFRTQEILLGQTAIGMNPTAVTAPYFPEDSGYATYDSREEIEGVVYHRLRGLRRLDPQPRRGSTFESDVYRAEIREPLDEHLAHYAQALFALASELRPSLLHSHSNHRNALVASAVAGALRIPHIYEVRGVWEESSVSRGVIGPNDDRYRLERDMETRCCREAGAVVTLSETMKQELVSRGIEPEKIFLVPNGANPARFPVVQHRSERLARKLRLGSGPVIGYAGSLSTYEGVSDLLRGFRRVLDVMPEVRALIIGDGRDAELAHATADELELGDSVVFAGRIDRSELLDYYSVIDIFAVPRPPFRVCDIVTPLKPYEAMATGRAVVVSDVRALQEMIVEGRTAVSFEAGNPDSLAAVCIELCRNPERRRELGAYAARWVRMNRDWATVAAGYLDAYNFASHALERQHLRAPSG
jgi:glycosyltransferase involved in cell wall biosynthesis